MQIDLPAAEQQRLIEQATAHGFTSVGDFVGEILSKVASLSDEATVFAELDEHQQAHSEQIVARGESDLAAGRVRSMREGLAELGAERGLGLDE